MRAILLVSSLALAASPWPAFAQVLPPLGSGYFGFPGVQVAPLSAASAGLSLADRWLGAGPSENPAILTGRAASVTPLMYRVSRQDLKAANFHYDEQAAFVGAGSAWVGTEVGRLNLSLYGAQPELREESSAFERGEQGGPVPPAVVSLQSTTRELRVGAAVSASVARMRIGAAAEWTRREDDYLLEVSSTPDAGTSQLTFSGDGVGFVAGATFESGAEPGSGVRVGASARYLPALPVEGTRSFVGLAADTSDAVTAEREAGWEGGVAARVPLGSAFAFHLSGSGRSAQAWEGFGVEGGAHYGWALGGEYHDPEEPWTARFGFGREHQEDVPEASAGLFGIGFGWAWSKSRLDLGLMRRALEHDDLPNSFDDRALATLSVKF